MPKELPRVTAKEITTALEKEGFTCVRQSGSHRIYKDAGGKRTTVPFHGNKILHPKVLKSILKDADISLERLNELLKK
jgi:predicted RNA binding protein YcfA (HicA-like mRNA interferase family)